MALAAAKLRHRLILQRPVESQSLTTGAINVTWQDVATVWAAIEPLSAREYIASQAESSRITARVTIRYRAGVTSKMRLYHAFKDVFYDIHGPLSDLNSGLEYLTIPVSEGIKYQVGDPSSVIPVSLAAPLVTGTPQNGMLLSGTDGLWANDPENYSYQWYVNDIPIVGANNPTWVIDASVNDIINLGVISSNDAGNSSEAFSESILVTV